jgi:hypothetical protein
MAAYQGKHCGPYDPRIDVIRTTYRGRHASPEKVVALDERRARRSRRQRRDSL